jgi:hypothetical protein
MDMLGHTKREEEEEEKEEEEEVTEPTNKIVGDAKEIKVGREEIKIWVVVKTMMVMVIIKEEETSTRGAQVKSNDGRSRRQKLFDDAHHIEAGGGTGDLRQHAKVQVHRTQK